MAEQRSTPGGPRRPAIIGVVVAALVIEGVVGAIAIALTFGGEFWLELTGRGSEAGIPLWVPVWESVQLVAALSLPVFGLLVWRGRPVGYLGALILQGLAIGASGYRVADTLPDTWWLVAFVMVTTILLALKPVRDWCLGRSDEAFEALIVHPEHDQPPKG
jgi:hypothetical protein